MGLQTLQQLIESQFAGACVSVDLLRIASSVSSPYQGRVALSLVVDAECCLDRLYGGYVSGNDIHHPYYIVSQHSKSTIPFHSLAWV